MVVSELIRVLQSFEPTLPVVVTQERGFDFAIQRVALTTTLPIYKDEVTIYIDKE